ncbi:MAG: hypothetical protein HY815_33675, partial [Candidatus Riflebacteria bacterium]|nr:hypothetical protein [Candidatus Riflebacteria bacterium]
MTESKDPRCADRRSDAGRPEARSGTSVAALHRCDARSEDADFPDETLGLVLGSLEDPDREVLLLAIQAARGIDDPALVPKLTSLVDHPDPEVAARAYELLMAVVGSHCDPPQQRVPGGGCWPVRPARPVVVPLSAVAPAARAVGAPAVKRPPALTGADQAALFLAAVVGCLLVITLLWLTGAAPRAAAPETRQHLDRARTLWRERLAIVRGSARPGPATPRAVAASPRVASSPGPSSTVAIRAVISSAPAGGAVGPSAALALAAVPITGAVPPTTTGTGSATPKTGVPSPAPSPSVESFSFEMLTRVGNSAPQAVAAGTTGSRAAREPCPAPRTSGSSKQRRRSSSRSPEARAPARHKASP